GHDRAVDALPGRDVAHAVVDRDAVHVPPGAAGGHAADDLRPVVEALAGQVHGLAPGDALDDDRRVPVDEDGHQLLILATARPAAVLADGVEERERAAARADHEPEVAVELAHVAGHAAVIRGVDLRAPQLELGRRAGLARLLLADAELLEELRVLRARVALQVDVAVEDEEAAVMGLPERVDLGEREVVAEEDLDQGGDDRRQAVQVLAADADGGDRLLRPVGREGEERRDVDLPHVLGVPLGDLLDVYAPHVAEDEDGELPPPVPG